MRQRPIIAIAALAIALAAGCAHKANDAALVTNIKAQMFSDPQLKDANLQVTASNGEVTLSGTAPNDAAHLDAYKIASQMAGVVRVNDKISVDSTSAQMLASNEPATVPGPVAMPAPSQAAPPQPEPLPAAKMESSRKQERAREKERRERSKKLRSQDKNTETAQPTDQDRAPIEPTDEMEAQAAGQPVVSPPPPSDSAQQQAPEAAPAPQPAPSGAPAAPPPPAPQQMQISAGTTITIRMIDSVDSSVNQPGEIFHASLDQPLVVGDRVAVPKDADVYVRLVSATSSGKFTGKSELHLELVKMEFQGQSYPLVSSTYSLNGASQGKETAKKVGVGAVLGTLIGAIAGGGRGAAIGAGVGAAGGGVYQGATHGGQVRIPSETKLDFRLEQPVTVTVMPPLDSQSQ
ncbi:MAG TPA: BON domain-containing protein [Candidatus Dormibacteraeota bacterium]|nr:BON domain-containing protein [Candidatus Dormibacteraeota bacterium]